MAAGEAEMEEVRDLWRAFARDPASLLDRVGSEVEWSPASADGRVVRGRDALETLFGGLAEDGIRVLAETEGMQAYGEAVIVRATLRRATPQWETEITQWWLYRFDAGRMVRAEAHATLAAAKRSHDLARRRAARRGAAVLPFGP